jgi:tetratricopeptide (TPR) repeat protein/predicted Ser/Thr protein kinase
MGDLVGQKLAHFLIEAKLGEGGMGVVYRAIDEKLSRTVALKVLPERFSREDDARRRLMSEARAAAAVTHPNIATVYEVGEEEGRIFVAMEYVEGKVLSSILDAGQLPIEDALHVARGILRAIAKAHDKAILHRDLKPDNVMLNDENEVKVLDFGVAKFREVDESARASIKARAAAAPKDTLAGQIVGTPGYMAPEQAQGLQVDQRADIFSFGVVLYVMLTGEAPFEGDGPFDVLFDMTGRAPLLASKVNPAVPTTLALVVDRCLATKPGRRFATARDVLAALENLEIPGAAPSIPPPKDVLRARGGLQVLAPSALSPPRRVAPLVYADTELAPKAAGAGKRRWIAAGVAALALSVAVAAGLRWRRVESAVAPAASAPVSGLAPTAAPGGSPKPIEVLIFGIENRTGDPVFDRTLDAVVDSAMRRSERLDPRSGTWLQQLAADVEPARAAIDDTFARKLGERDGARVIVVRGFASTQGKGFSLSVTATEAATGVPVVSRAIDAGAASDVVPTMGRLAYEIRTALGDPPPANLEDAEMTGLSASIEADHEYALGVGFGLSGQQAEAAAHLERAVSLDPEFAQAHMALAVALGNLLRKTDAAKHNELAFTLADRMGERDRLRFLGIYYRYQADYERSATMYRELLRRWPRDVNAEVNIVGDYLLSRDWRRALRAAQQAAGDHPRNPVARANLAGAYLYTGDLETAARTAQEALDELPHPSGLTYEYLALALAQLGRSAEAADAYRKLEPIDPSLAAQGSADLAAAEGRTGDAIAILEKAVADDVARKDADGASRKWVFLAELRLKRGDKAAALALAARASASTAAPGVLFSAAHVALEAGEAKGVVATAARLAQEVPPGPRAYAKILEAEALRLGGKPKDAVRKLDEAAHIVDAWLVHDYLAKAYLDAGAFDQAKSEAELCLARKGEAVVAFADNVPTFRYVPPITYYLARAKEGVGAPDTVDAYKAFLAMEPGADHDPVVDDARRRIAGR